VLVFFMPFDGPARVAASINYGWEKPKYYRRWSRVPDLGRTMSGAVLEPFGEQGPHCDEFLILFKGMVKDPELVNSFQRHYQMVQRAINPSSCFKGQRTSWRKRP
jgi:hypothetical protein